MRRIIKHLDDKKKSDFLMILGTITPLPVYTVRGEP